MYSHTTLGTNDPDRAVAFYDAVMAVLGHPQLMRRPGGAAYGSWTGEKFFVGPAIDGAPATVGNGTHLAFICDDRAKVDAFHAAALANGGTDAGAPGPRPNYHANYYGGYVRDPDGNKLQAVCHRAPDRASGLPGAPSGA